MGIVIPSDIMGAQQITAIERPALEPREGPLDLSLNRFQTIVLHQHPQQMPDLPRALIALLTSAFLAEVMDLLQLIRSIGLGGLELLIDAAQDPLTGTAMGDQGQTQGLRQGQIASIDGIF